MKKRIIQTTLMTALTGLANLSVALSGAPSVIATDNTAIADHQKSWEFKAIAQQNRLDNAVPYSEGFRLQAHNAFNSSAYSSIVYIDPNHGLSITDQLNIGVRSLELDAHWIYQTKDLPGGHALLLCHGQPNHGGCSGLERYVKDAIVEINDWLRKNPSEVISIMIQDETEGRYAELAEAFSLIHDLIYKAEPVNSVQSFYSVVKTLTEEQVLQAGKQVLVMGPGDAGEFTRYTHSGSFNSMGAVNDFAKVDEVECIADKSRQQTNHRLFDDGTNIGAIFVGEGRITAELAAKAGRCGASALGADHLVIGDTRAKASIWSWAENEPSGGQNQDCGFIREDGRYYDGQCDNEGSYYVCSDGPLNWKVTQAYGDWSDNADTKCKAEFGDQYAFSMPTNSQQNEWLKAALDGKPHAWVNYSDTKNEGIWLTPKHQVDYSEGVASISSVTAGDEFEFFMRASANNCELQWQGGDIGSGDRNAKFDCMAKGDAMIFVADEHAQNHSDGTVSIHGKIITKVAGYNCGLEWDGSLDDGERNGKFDCSGSADPLTITSFSDGSTDRVRITSDNNCGLQWAGGDVDSRGERNAKFDCDPSWDDMTLYGIKALNK